MERIFKSFSRRRQTAYKKAINKRLVAASDSFGSLHSGPVGYWARVATWHVLRAHKKGRRIAGPQELFN